MSALRQLADELRAEGGLLASTVVSDDASVQPHGDAVAERGDAYPLLVEAIREGYLQHYATGRVVRPEDPDLALLAGDRLYGARSRAARGGRRSGRGGRIGRRDRAVRAGARGGRSGTCWSHLGGRSGGRRGPSEP